MSLEEWALRKISGHPRLSIGERRQVVAELAADGLTQRDDVPVRTAESVMPASDALALSWRRWFRRLTGE